jgi:hypothetical protein
MKAALGMARVRRVEPGRSAVEITSEKKKLDENEVYQAVLATVPIPPMNVRLEGDKAGVELIRTALATAGETGRQSLFVREAPGAAAEIRLVAVAPGHYRTLRPADGRRLIADVEGFTPESARKAVANLEHITRWTRVAQLGNPGSELANRVRMEIYTAPPEEVAEGKATPVTGTELSRLYEWREGKWRRPPVWVKLVNDSDGELWFALVGLTQAFGVQSGLLPGGAVLLKRGENTWANTGKAIFSEVPDELWKQGIVEVQDVLKLLISTEPMDAALLEQGDLDHPVLRRGTLLTRSAQLKGVLNRLFDRVQTRGLSTEPDEDEVLADWTTKEMTFTTVRPLESTPIAKSADAQLFPGVILLAHPALMANARLTVAPVASRDVAGGLVLPPLLRDDPTVAQPFLFSSSRGGAPGLSVLELHDVKNHEAVTRRQPLRLEISQPLGPGEHLLPVTHDGEFFLPIGRGIGHGDRIEVVLDALPQPINTRSLFSAVRIFFQKVISQHFGTQYHYPLLAAYAPGVNGEAQVTADPASVKLKVAAAKRIVLYIHGIIGEARGMAASSTGLAGPPPVSGLGERYDLILTFDYENLNTPIEKNAQLLKQRLIEIGLGPNHGKTLHIIAHSMGGLVSRWLIEREGGNEIAQHLVMLGTPNGGSPWPTVEDWGITALSFGLNNLVPIPWAGKILGGLISAVEKVDVALDQMHPSSEFLKKLGESLDPKIPYSIVAGNTSLIGKPTSQEVETRKSLLDRLRSLHLLHLATAPAFFGEPNDIAVSVANIRRQPAGRDPAAKILEVPCDHLTYFSTEAGLHALNQALPLSRVLEN